jgi:hypothetical protein
MFQKPKRVSSYTYEVRIIPSESNTFGPSWRQIIPGVTLFKQPLSPEIGNGLVELTLTPDY